jgi:molybdopterin converting factor subunit 1
VYFHKAVFVMPRSPEIVIAVQLNVLLFAGYAEALGTRELAVTLGEGATVGELLKAVRGFDAAKALPPAAVAVNQEYAAEHTRLAPGDEVAIIPPVAGG